MAWSGENEEARSRQEREREALAASVEELADQKGTWNEEEYQQLSTGKTTVVPPLLHLQSRPWSAVRLEVTNRTRIEHPSASLPTDVAPAQFDPPLKRLGRSTRIHLQAVRLERMQEPVTERISAIEGGGSGARREESAPVVPVSPQESAPAVRMPASLPGGSGFIEQGRAEVSVSTPHISERSVVMVMLTGNPGPVVVQYVSLYPRHGFTCHLSAPVVTPTPFNYIIWPS
jgi:hypothetical protein